MKTLIFILLTTGFFGCSSLSDKIVGKMNDEDRPKWADQLKVISEDGDKITFLGFVESDAGAKISAVFRTSDHAARAELSKMIKTKFSSLLQNHEEGLSGGGELVRYYGQEVSRNTLTESKLVGRYWEKVQTINEDGEKLYRLRAYSLLEVSRSRLRKLIAETVNNEKIPAEIKNEILEQLKTFGNEDAN